MDHHGGKPLMATYRILFEGVGTSSLPPYMSADPRLDYEAVQTVPNSRIPERDWHPIETIETDDPWGQFDQLKGWADADIGFVRNVRVEKLVTRNPYTWTPIPNPQAFRKALT
jgi:hypothetical protein